MWVGGSFLRKWLPEVIQITNDVYVEAVTVTEQETKSNLHSYFLANKDSYESSEMKH